MILDCSSYDSAKKSLVRIFGVKEEELSSILSSLSPYEGDQPPEECLYNSVCEAIGDPSGDISVIWFHGTRVEDENLFHERGILPKSSAREFIEPRLKELAEGLFSSGDNPFTLSLSGKQGPHDEGPFAFLIKDVAIQAPGVNHSYVEVPEIVEDIAGTLLGENYFHLVERFQEVATPYIVSFLANPKGYEIGHALWFLKLVEDGESEIDAGSTANTFFNSEGETILPEKIQYVEPIEIV